MPPVFLSRTGLKPMAEIRFDADKAERTIAQMIRDEGGVLPGKANVLAANICRRLLAAMPPPPAQNYRIIANTPPYASDFAVAIATVLADAKGRALAPEDVWRLVYERGRDLPTTVDVSTVSG